MMLRPPFLNFLDSHRLVSTREGLRSTVFLSVTDYNGSRMQNMEE